MNFRLCLYAALFSSLGVGCGVEPECLEEERSLDYDEQSPLGYSARALIESLSLTREGELGWYSFPENSEPIIADEDRTQLRLAIRAVEDEVLFIESRVNPKNKNESGKFCEDRLSFSGLLDLDSDDGRLQETGLEVVLESYRAGQLQWDGDFALEEVRGTIRDGLEVSEGDVSLASHGALEADGWSAWVDQWIRIEDDNGVAFGHVPKGVLREGSMPAPYGD